ncbi:unnamed protein product, partial [Rotaria sordida]
MHYNNNHTPSATSISSPMSNTSSTTLHHLLPTSQSGTSSVLHIPSSSSYFSFPSLPFQQQYQYSHSNESQPQTLSPDEWSLIASLRMMKNLNFLPPFQPSPFSA